MRETGLALCGAVMQSLLRNPLADPFVLQDGRAVAEGTPGQVLTPELIGEVYGVRAEVTVDGDRPVVRFLLRRDTTR